MFSQKISLDQKVIQVTLRTYVLENSMLFVNKSYWNDNRNYLKHVLNIFLNIIGSKFRILSLITVVETDIDRS